MKILYFVWFIFALTVAFAAQTKVVTNLDLEKYRDTREQASADYLANYARLGRPSPEELARLEQADRAELALLSAKLRSVRFETERLSAQRLIAEQRVVPVHYVVKNSIPYEYFNYSSGYRRYGERRHRQPEFHPDYQPGYFAGGNFWPTGLLTPPSPILVRKR